jgi:hypothetical protein
MPCEVLVLQITIKLAQCFKINWYMKKIGASRTNLKSYFTHPLWIISHIISMVQFVAHILNRSDVNCLF